MRIRTLADLAAAIRARRRELRLKQSDVAAQLGVSRVWISQFENEKARAEIGLVLRLIAALGLAIDLSTEARTPRQAIDLDRIVDAHRPR